MKRSKKLVSIILMLSFLTMCIAPLNASVGSLPNRAISYSEVFQLDSYNYYVETSSVWDVCLMADENERRAEISILFHNEPNNIYSYQFSKEFIDGLNFNYNSLEFWETLMEEGIRNKNNASIIQKSSIVTPINQDISLLDADGDALVVALKGKYGNEYSESLKSTDTTYPGATIRLYEGLTLRANKKFSLNFVSGLTVTSFITAVIGVSPLPERTKQIASFLSVFIAGGAFIAGGSLYQYQCLADFYRYTKINNGSTIYTMTSKTYNHIGYSHPSGSGVLLENDYELTYTDSSTYYNSFSSQFADAYSIFS